jgi:stress-induced morphogen
MLERHRMVMAALADEMKGPIHALTLDVRTPDETAR